jgi:hypothetical protein
MSATINLDIEAISKEEAAREAEKKFQAVIAKTAATLGMSPEEFLSRYDLTKTELEFIEGRWQMAYRLN